MRFEMAGIARNIELYNSAFSPIARLLHDSIRGQLKDGATDPLFIASETLKALEESEPEPPKAESAKQPLPDESEEITVAVRADDLLKGDTGDPERHPIALALRRQKNVDDARVTKNETLVRRGNKWFRYDAPDRRLFKQLQKTLTASG
jgi:hypothetical protein